MSMECQKYLISQFRIFAITETWLSSHIYDNEILSSNFIIYRNDRNSRGGGVMLAIDQSISIKTIPSPEDIEAVVVHLTQHHASYIIPPIVTNYINKN